MLELSSEESASTQVRRMSGLQKLRNQAENRHKSSESLGVAMCSHCESEHPDEQRFVNEFNERRQKPVDQALEFEDLQTYLGRMWALYRAPSTAFLIQQRSFPSPLLGVKRMAENWEELC